MSTHDGESSVLYYLLTPVTGAALVPIIYMLVRVGILSPADGSAGGSSVASLNFIAIYAFAAMTGLFSKVAADKLAEVFQNLFRSEPTTKDQIGAVKSPSSASPTTSGRSE